MITVFVIRNQHGQYLSRSEDWTDGADKSALFCTRHKDQAINTLVEHNAHDIDMRAAVIEVAADESGRPNLQAVVEPKDTPIAERPFTDAAAVEPEESPTVELETGHSEPQQ